MSKSQRHNHATKRRVAIIEAGRTWAAQRVKFRRTPELLGHHIEVERWGDGYTEPREEYGTCTCGTELWQARQGYGYTEWTTWREHVTRSKGTRKLYLTQGGR